MINFSEFIAQRIDEATGQMNPLFAGDKQVAQLDRMIERGADKEEIIAELKKVVDKYTGKISDARKAFERLVNAEIRGIPKVKFLSDQKKIDSIISKAVTRKTGFAKLGDLVRGAVLFETKEQADEFVKKFVRKNGSSVIENETKERGGDKKYGYYGSSHLAVNIGGITVEIQVMTRKLWNYKGAAHDIYNKTRDTGVVDKFDRHQSNKLFSMGNRESVELLPEFTYEEMHDMQFDDWKDVDILA